MPSAFYSNGKLLISGEYVVLDGAKAWAIPTKFGQHLRVSQNDSGLLSWKSIDDKGLLWFEAIYKQDKLIEVSASDSKISKTLIDILSEARKMNPAFLMDSDGSDIETKLTFPKDWGLGSSSTLINNIAQWAKVDGYQLLRNTFKGSGYDIACAKTNSPIIYQLESGLPKVREIDKIPPFSNLLYFVYLNKKRNSRDAINAYRQRKLEPSKLIKKISDLTLEMISCNRIEDFERLMQLHETLLSDALGIPTVKEELFPDYKGSIKSLGAWGGDFILVSGNVGSSAYFTDKGYRTVIPFQKMIL